MVVPITISGFETRGLARSSPPSPSILIRNGIKELVAARDYAVEPHGLTAITKNTKNTKNGRPEEHASGLAVQPESFGPSD
jgi:hypothetical protein